MMQSIAYECEFGQSNQKQYKDDKLCLTDYDIPLILNAGIKCSSKQAVQLHRSTLEVGAIICTYFPLLLP
jgi:hypothetical protein